MVRCMVKALVKVTIGVITMVNGKMGLDTAQVLWNGLTTHMKENGNKMNTTATERKQIQKAITMKVNSSEAKSTK